jgi:hypothetical protein
MLLAGVSCIDNVPGGIVSLKGTKWKLAGAVNVETGELDEFEPTACAECFTLTFDTEYEASGHSISSNIRINLLDLRKYNYIHYIHTSETWIEDPSLPVDGERFMVTMAFIESSAVASEELKLFYNNKTEYLLFKRVIPLAGTQWKLAGAVNVETGELKEFEPKDCTECFTLTFDSDYTANGISVYNYLKIHFWPKPALIFMTEMGDNHIGDNQLYYDAWLTMNSYKIENHELKLFYNNNTEYLFYKPLQP